ncbi:hypothetical protein RJT34_00206 [Clitoria ternatea]|uniref:alcohol dehydrogenase n=1 Tax=Clitoria ternatea TaxID=43366 RepID=A0AAN9KIY8_CLITE
METSEEALLLNTCHVQKSLVIMNRSHMFLHSIALGFLFYYRVCFLLQYSETNKGSHLLPWLLVFVSEIILSFIWILDQAYRWNPVTRSFFPERLPHDDKLPHVDVFICTADPIKEPTLDVMNTLLSAMALDYPAQKLHVYISDDCGSPLTLHGVREAWKFASWWLPFCTRYRIKNRCPKAYFSALENHDVHSDFARSSVYVADKQKTKEMYETFKENIRTFRKDRVLYGDNPVGDHYSIIEVIQENINDDEVDNAKMPLLVYVSREKKPSQPHHFKAGALNVLLRVSAVMSNSPYILVLDCDMFCNDPSSARYAMCFHLDPKISSSLAFVQFPQKFHNISKNDIYDSQHRSLFTLQWPGLDGLKGPVMSGIDMQKLKEYFGSSNDFIKSLAQNYTSYLASDRNALQDESHLLASCEYEIGTKWGQEVGFLYDSVVEDYLTGFILHCNGWTSVFCDPTRPQFLEPMLCMAHIFPSSLLASLVSCYHPSALSTEWNTLVPKVYEMWDSMIEKVKATIYRHEGKEASEVSNFFEVVHKILNLRWSKSCTPLHCLAHSLNPRYYSAAWLSEAPNRLPPHQDEEVCRERNKCLKRYFPTAEERRKIFLEFSKFSSCAGDFASFDSIEDRWNLPPKEWWVMHGSHTPLLQKLALKLLIQPCSSSCCERNWSTYSFIHSLKRNKMDPKRAEDLVYVHSNLRLLSRKDDTYAKGETKLWDISGDMHAPLDDGAGFLELAEMSLDEPELEAMLFLDDGNGGDETETVNFLLAVFIITVNYPITEGLIIRKDKGRISLLPQPLKRCRRRETQFVRFCCFSMEEDANSEGKPIRCKAAVARRAGEALVIEEVIVAPPMSREVRIRVICTSLCHSDLTFWNLQHPPGIFPRILGHEAIGVVESVGKDITEVTKGDVVIPVFLPDCGECVDCKSTKSNQCTNIPFKVSPCMPRDGTTRFTDQNGEIIYHFLCISSFSEYTVIDIANLVKIDPEIPPNRACLLSCGVSTGVGAAWRTAGVESGSTVAIFGLGSIGLAVAEGARLCGATRIIGVDVNPEKFKIGKKFGVTDFVHAGECENKPVSQVIIEMTGGGADYCFECVGKTSLVQEAFASCRKGWGKTIVLGVDQPGAMLSLSSYDVLHQGKTLMGSLFGGLKPKCHVPILLKRYMDKELQLDEFVTHEVEFKDINKAFDLLSNGQCLRCVIWMDK